jgi:hypothetical protein
LVVQIGSATCLAEIPDWQLIPIARYADYTDNAVISLFGEYSNDQEYEVLFHPAILNTLLGLRLLQADILLMNLELAGHLPTVAGRVILGEGELMPDPLLSNQAAVRISDVLQSAQFRSWVLTDDKIDIVFAPKDGFLSFSGGPYFYFWRYTNSWDQLNMERAKRVGSYNARAEALNRMVAKYNDDVNRYNEWLEKQGLVDEATFAKLQQHVRETEVRLRADSLSIAELETQLKADSVSIARLDERMETEAQAVGGPTDNLKNRRKDLHELNPPAYTAAERTARYAALFRYVKRIHPEEWNAFLSSLRKVDIEPDIMTPNRVPKAISESVH